MLELSLRRAIVGGYLSPVMQLTNYLTTSAQALLRGVFFVSLTLPLWNLQAQQPQTPNAPELIEREQQRKEGGYFPKQAVILDAESATTAEEQEAIEDFGIIRKAARPLYWQVASTTGFEYDTNARLSSTDEIGSPIISERLSIRYSREFAPQWTFITTARQQFFWFTEVPEDDFMGQALDGEVAYQVVDVLPKFKGLIFDPRYFIGGNLYRYEDFNNGNELLKAAVLRGGADHAIPFFNGKSALFYGYVGSWEHTTPASSTKHQHQIFGGWNQTVIPRYVSAQAFYRFSYSDYLDVNREDLNNLLGLTVNYRVTEWLNLSAFVNHMENDSNAAEYRNLAAGVQAYLDYRF
jgi:hypothetical protein